jgi:hypothetical protein
VQLELVKEETRGFQLQGCFWCWRGLCDKEESCKKKG